MTRNTKVRLARWRRILLLPVILLFAAALSVFEVAHYVSYESLAANHEWLLERVAQNEIGMGLLFLATYTLLVALSIPGAAFRTMAAGFLFGPVIGTIYAVLGATIGAIILFLIARTSLGEMFRTRTEGLLPKLRKEFQEHALSYLLFLRLVPLVPFWLLNLAAAFLSVRLNVFAIGTFVGIIPGTAVFASVGSGLGELLDQGQRPDFSIIANPEIFLPILGLALLSLVPVLIRRLKLRRNARGT